MIMYFIFCEYYYQNFNTGQSIRNGRSLFPYVVSFRIGLPQSSIKDGVIMFRYTIIWCVFLMKSLLRQFE